MNKIKPNVFCSAYGHNYFRLNHANENTPDLICKCCKSYFKFESDGKISPVVYKESAKSLDLIYMKITA